MHKEVVMYRQNPLLKKVLITADEVVFHAPVKNEVHRREIEQSIIIAEERFIRPQLGFDLYMELIGQKNTVVTAANKDALETQINQSMPSGSTAVTLKEGDIVNALELMSTASYKELWTEHLWKLTAEAVMLITLPEGYIRFGSEGTHMSQPPAGPMSSSNIVAPELKALQYAIDKKLRDRIDPLTEAMHLWICYKRSQDKTLFTKYAQKCPCDDLPDGLSYKRKTQFLTDLYDDDENEDCC